MHVTCQNFDGVSCPLCLGARGPIDLCMYIAHQCNFGAYDSGNRDGDLCLSRVGIWRKRKIEGGNVLYRTRLSISLLFVGVFLFFVFYIIIQIVDLLCHFPSLFLKKKTKRGPLNQITNNLIVSLTIPRSVVLYRFWGPFYLDIFPSQHVVRISIYRFDKGSRVRGRVGVSDRMYA